MPKRTTNRIIVSLPAEIAKKLRHLAALESRSVSNFAGVIVGRALAADPEIQNAAAELRTLGADPVMALRDKLAEVQRDQFLSTSTNETKNQPPAPPVISESQLCHSPAASRVLAGRATTRPALRVG